MTGSWVLRVLQQGLPKSSSEVPGGIYYIKWKFIKTICLVLVIDENVRVYYQLFMEVDQNDYLPVNIGSR